MKKNSLLLCLAFLFCQYCQSQSPKAVQKWVEENDWVSINKYASKPKMAAMQVYKMEENDWLLPQHSEGVLVRYYSLLEYAIFKNQNIVARKLLQAGNPNAGLPLQAAILKSNFELLGLLLDKGADPHKQISLFNQTTLEFIFQWNRADALEFMLKKGAFKDSLSHIAALSIRQEKLDFLRILLEQGLDPNQEDNSHLITLALNTRNILTVQLLLHYKANIQTMDKSLNSLLMLAIQNEDLSMVRTLLDKGIRVNDKNILGKTPLDMAAELQNKKMVDMLILHGADTTGIKLPR